jgi:hypothetical protein
MENWSKPGDRTKAGREDLMSEFKSNHVYVKATGCSDERTVLLWENRKKKKGLHP